MRHYGIHLLDSVFRNAWWKYSGAQMGYIAKDAVVNCGNGVAVIVLLVDVHVEGVQV